jgi:hypothetical protein
VFARLANEVIHFDIHYILENFDASPKIIMYVSDEDQDQLMKEKGII